MLFFAKLRIYIAENKATHCNDSDETSLFNPNESIPEATDHASSSPAQSSETPEPDREPLAEEMKYFIRSSFGNLDDKPVHCHSFYTCQGSRCSSVTQTEMNRLRATSQKDRFQHQWILDKKLSFCKKTGLNWLVYIEGRGMFCLLCRKHDATNLQNKSKKFNTEPAVRFKRKSVEEHSTSQQHKAAVTAELLSRVSVFQREFEEREKSKEDVYFNVFLALYWIAKEEIVNTKFTSLLEVVEKMGL